MSNTQQPNPEVVPVSEVKSQQSPREDKVRSNTTEEGKEGNVVVSTDPSAGEAKSPQGHPENPLNPEVPINERKGDVISPWNIPKIVLRILTLISLLVAIGFLLTPGSQNSRNNANIFLLVSFALLAANLIYKHYGADKEGVKKAYFGHENISLLMLGLVLLGGWFYMTGKARISMRFQHEWLIPIACLLFVLVLVPFVRHRSTISGQGLDKVMQLILLLVVGISVVSVFAPGAQNQNTFLSGALQWVVLGLTVLIVLAAGYYIMFKQKDNLKLPQYPKSLFALNSILLGLFAVSLVLFIADSDVIPAQNFDTPRVVQDVINLVAFVVLLGVIFVAVARNRNKKPDLHTSITKDGALVTGGVEVSTTDILEEEEAKQTDSAKTEDKAAAKLAAEQAAAKQAAAKQAENGDDIVDNPNPDNVNT